jgi:hypothetical protein
MMNAYRGQYVEACGHHIRAIPAAGLKPDGRPESRKALIPGLHRWLLFQEAREGAHAQQVAP